MEYDLILQKVQAYVSDFIKQHKIAELCFHNDSHTSEVVSAATEIAHHYALNKEDLFIVLCAAYFHDLGYFHGGAKQHESRGAQLARTFLEEQSIDKHIQDQVVGCIMATRMPQQPTNLLEQILCDADLFHLGGENFETRNKLMRKEAETVGGKKIGKEEWRKQTIALMQQHHYHTDYAREKLNREKDKNLKILLDKEKKEGKQLTEDNLFKKNEERQKKPERGIETMFRITSSNNQRLSDMADNKANILLTVNSIILSMVIAVLLRKLDSNEHLVIPTIMLLSFSVSTMVVAILSTIPKVPPGVFTQEEINKKTVNLLFFGNFYKMKLEEYKEGMNRVMDDSEFLYGMLTKDVYAQGVVLGRKYKLLRIAYAIFMLGLILSSISFLISVSI
ncbi:HD domain protein [Sphingobacterium spiritivorum ATCC 33300]|uniref:HD domain protein n=1 Tax=Sphingobacterium spiritivorum ATCC 33300 TaxID=525372 RepID=C2G1X2_SPHSI|nr:Pycsar system effector family protein [Sphingobacterium spiritivorum]EEI91031.1 HD domain protein [Sphingobacterium spiritivorum ATCC 33300]QQS97901.1 HD domain-containing protein [Sphingobacterium spiritivorum]